MDVDALRWMHEMEVIFSVSWASNLPSCGSGMVAVGRWPRDGGHLSEREPLPDGYHN